MHVAGADGAEATVPPAEGDEDRATQGGAGDRDEALFGQRMVAVGSKARAVGQGVFDFGPCQAVPGAFRRVAAVPVELHLMYVRFKVFRSYLMNGVGWGVVNAKRVGLKPDLVCLRHGIDCPCTALTRGAGAGARRPDLGVWPRA